MLRTLLFALLALGGCRASTPQPLEAPSSPPRVPDVDEPDEPAPLADGLVLVSGPAGTRLLTPEGETVRVLSQTPALAPRWLAGREAAVVLDAEGRLTKIDLQGNETPLAELPTEAPCPGEDADPLTLSMDEEFWIAPGGTHVCLVLSDAFPNMRDAQRDIAVQLSDGSVRSQVSFGADGCGGEDATDSLNPCESPPYAEMLEMPSPLPGGRVHSVSPDGNWTLVEASAVLGDVLHLQHLLVRKDDEAAFPLSWDPGPWPAPVTDLPAQLDPDAYIEGLPDMQGGETITWVGPRHLVLDQLLYVAGERIVSLDGNVAP